MKGHEIHYEVFRRVGRGGGWALVEAMPKREDAVDLARAILSDGRAAAVRVVKETFQPATGEYVSLVVLEEGDIAVKKNKNSKVDDSTNPVPCFKPDDLYNYHARATLTRLIGDWLSRNKLTPTELIHSAAALERFEATGTTFQHAIQKTAVAQASGTEVPVAQIMKQLTTLANTAIKRVYTDEKKGVFPDCVPGDFAKLAARIAAEPDALYRLNGSLAKYLAPGKTWDAKLQLLLALMPEIPAEGAARALLLGAIDSLVSELLNGSAALVDLLGHNPDLGHALINLVELFMGTTVHAAEGAGRGINELARSFAADELPASRTAIANRILAELRGLHRLSSVSVEDELRMLRRLANDLVRGQGKYLSHEDLISAFTDRSKRVVNGDALSEYLADAKTADVKFDRLMLIEENILGVENKRTLAGFIYPLVVSNAFEDQVAQGEGAPQRLKRLAEMQTRALRGGFQEEQKTQIAVALDAVAMRIDDRAKFLNGVETKIINPIERAQTLIKLLAGGVFTQGEMTARAKRILFAALSRPGFVGTYAAQNGVGRDLAIATLAGQLEKAGIAPEESLRLFAA